MQICTIFFRIENKTLLADLNKYTYLGTSKNIYLKHPIYANMRVVCYFVTWVYTNEAEIAVVELGLDQW